MDETIKCKKRKFNARKPNKKWTDAEAAKILDFIIATADEFEEPTVKTYYNTLLKQTNIDADYSLVKDKVRNMKISYYKAREWCEDQTNAGVCQREVQRRVLRTCREYERLNTIFGEIFGRVATPEPTIIKSDSVEFLDIENSICSQLEQAFADEDDERDLTRDHTPQLTQEQHKHSTSVEYSPLEISQTPSPKPIKHPTVSHAEQEIKEPKWQEKFDKSLGIQERQLKLKEAKLNTEMVCRNVKLDLKKLEMEKNERIKKLEIEKNERIALSEIKEKFHYENYCQNKEFELQKLEMEMDESIKKLEIEKNERITMFEIEMKYKMSTK